MFGHGYPMGWVWLWVLLIIIGLLVLAFVIVRVATGGVKRDSAREGAVMRTARQILDERYAKGELTTDEYRERLSVLSEPPLDTDG